MKLTIGNLRVEILIRNSTNESTSIVMNITYPKNKNKKKKKNVLRNNWQHMH